MATYRKSRSIEASVVDYIEDELTDASWSGVTVQKHYKNIREVTLPVIVARVADTAYDRIQIGDSTMHRKPIVIIDIYGSDDGNRLDLKDFLASVLKDGMAFYDYTTVKSGRTTSVDTKTENGRITVENIEDTPLDEETDKSSLDVIDRYRHRITLSCSLSILEA